MTHHGGRAADNGGKLHTFCKEAEDKLLPKNIARTEKIKLLLEEYKIMLEYVIPLYPENTGTLRQSSFKACCSSAGCAKTYVRSSGTGRNLARTCKSLCF